MSKNYAYAIKGTKKYYFTGAGFDSVPFSMKKYTTLSALKKAVEPYAARLPKGAKLYSEVIGKTKPIKKAKKKTVKKKVIKKKVIKKKVFKKKKR